MELPPCVTEHRLIVAIDRRDTTVDADTRLGQLVPVLEVMVQEGIRVFSLCLADDDVLGELREIFDERADFGLHDVSSVDAMRRAASLRPAFVLLNGDEADQLAAAEEVGLCALPAALTPNEIRRAHTTGAPAVQVMPADLFGSSYPEQLQVLVPGVPLVARGGLGGWSLGRWFEAGALAGVADTNLLSDAIGGGNLSHLRDRCRTFLEVVPGR